MAATIQPHRLPPTFARPELRLVEGGRSSAPVRHAGPRPLHLALGLVLLLVVALGAIAVGRGALAGLAPAPAGAGASAPAASGAASAGTTVVVQPGDTVWSIARDLQPQGDVRSLVDQLVAANGATPLVPGDRLVVPS